MIFEDQFCSNSFSEDSTEFTNEGQHCEVLSYSVQDLPISSKTKFLMEGGLKLIFEPIRQNFCQLPDDKKFILFRKTSNCYRLIAWYLSMFNACKIVNDRLNIFSNKKIIFRTSR